MAKDGQGHIEIPLFPRGRNHDAGGDYLVGDYGNVSCNIDLKDYAFFVLKDEENPHSRVLKLKPRKPKQK